MNRRAAIEVLLETEVPIRFLPRCYNRDNGDNQISWVQEYTGVCEERSWTREAQDLSLLEAVSREQLVKMQ
jgi:hypothetical protein